MAIYEIEGPDGRIFEIEGPQGATAEQLSAAVNSLLKSKPREYPRTTTPESELASQTTGGERFMAGMGRRFLDIADAVSGPVYNREKDTLTEKSLDDSLAATAGGAAADLATMLGGGAVTKAVTSIPTLAASLPRLVRGVDAARRAVVSPANWKQAVAGGAGYAAATTSGDILDRMKSGMAAGGAAGVIGKAIPWIGDVAARGVRQVREGTPAMVGRVLSEASGLLPDDLARAIRGGNVEFVPGSAPTTYQAAMVPGISQLKRSAQAAGGDFSAAEQIQNAARIAELERMAPGASGLTSIEARTNTGRELAGKYAANRGTFKAAERELWNAPELQAIELDLNPDQVRSAIAKYYPGETFNEAPPILKRIAAMADEGNTRSHEEMQKLRSMVGQLSRDKFNTDETGRAAALAVKDVLSQSYDDAVAKGTMSPDAMKVLQDARHLTRMRKQRLETGPQGQIRLIGTDGLPKKQGAEVSDLFFSSGASQADDAAAFRTAFPNDRTAQEAMSTAIAADIMERTTNANGQLSAAKLGNYANRRKEALKGLLSDEQLSRLDAVLKDAKRAAEAEGLNRVTNSDTTQKLLGAGLIENPWVSRSAALLPKVGPAAADWLKNAIRQRNARLVSEALIDPNIALRALQARGRVAAPVDQGLLNYAGPAGTVLSLNY